MVLPIIFSILILHTQTALPAINATGDILTKIVTGHTATTKLEGPKPLILASNNSKRVIPYCRSIVRHIVKQ